VKGELLHSFGLKKGENCRKGGRRAGKGIFAGKGMKSRSFFNLAEKKRRG